ncbi:MAG TPA: flagellar type III secretion system protein FliR [Firmicutes bacterium]|nr:flagellar type III secretion system protein FliR [Bacillota bacterium]
MLDFVYWTKAYQLFLCLVARLSGFLATAPFFASRNIQPSVRGFLSILLALLFLPLFSAGDLLLADTGWSLVLMLLKEVVLGLTLGYASSIVFAAFQVAGQIIDMQMGFGMINVLDPQSGNQIPLIGNYLYLIAMLVFLAYDGHHFLLHALWSSWQLVPPGGTWGSPDLLWEILRATAVMFIAGIEIATPVLGALFLADLALAVLARTMPQLNVFVVGLPMKSLLGLFTLALSVPVYGVFLQIVLTEVQRTLDFILSLMPP